MHAKPCCQLLYRSNLRTASTGHPYKALLQTKVVDQVCRPLHACKARPVANYCTVDQICGQLPLAHPYKALLQTTVGQVCRPPLHPYKARLSQTTVDQVCRPPLHPYKSRLSQPKCRSSLQTSTASIQSLAVTSYCTVDQVCGQLPLHSYKASIMGLFTELWCT